MSSTSLAYAVVRAEDVAQVDQAIFVDQATDASVSSDTVLLKIDRFGQRLQRRSRLRACWAVQAAHRACRGLRGPQRRSFAHCVSSPMVTNVSSGCRPASRAASLGGSRPLNERDATSVSRTTASAGGSGKVRVPGPGHERQERVKFLIGLERVTAQLVNRADRVCAGRLPDQLIKRNQVLAASIVSVLGARARRNHLRLPAILASRLADGLPPKLG